MGDYDHPSGEKAQGNEPFFSIVESVILERDARAGKHLFGVLEPQTVLGEVAAILRSVPFVVRPRM